MVTTSIVLLHLLPTKISYTRKFDKASDGKTNYEAIYVPFNPTAITDGTKNLKWQVKDGEANDFLFNAVCWF